MAKQVAKPERGDEDAAQGRAEDPGHVERDRVQGHGVGQVLRRDQLRDETLPGRVIEDVDAAEGQRQQVDHPHLDDTGGDQAREGAGQ